MRPPGLARGHANVPAVLRSPYLLAQVEPAPGTPAPGVVGPARKLADQKGFPTSKLAFSKKISDPETTVYPSRIVYQATDDAVSLYVVSFRVADKAGHVKLLKLEGPGKGRWYEVPIARTTDETGKVIPGLMTDFMVVPQASTSLVWWYVISVDPIFENDTTPSYGRVIPDVIETSFRLAREGFKNIPSYASEITAANINDVISNGVSILMTTMYAVDSASAAYDTCRIGFQAYKKYFEVGHDLIDSSKKILDAAYAIEDAPSRLPELSEKIALYQNDAERRGLLHDAYLARAGMLTVWDFSVNLGLAQATWAQMRTVMGELIGLIHDKKIELLRQGHAEENLTSIQALASAYVARYDKSNNAFWNEVHTFFGERNADVSSSTEVLFMTPLLLDENTKVIARELESIKRFSPVSNNASLSGIGAVPSPPNLNKSYNEVRKRFEAIPNVKIIHKGVTTNLPEFVFSFLEKTVKDILSKTSAETQSLLNADARPLRTIFVAIASARRRLVVAQDVFDKAKKNYKDVEADKNSTAVETSNAKNALNKAETALTGVKNDIENEHIKINKYGPASRLENWLEVMEPIHTVTADTQATTADKMVAYLKVFTRIANDGHFIRAFYVTSRKSVAEFMYYNRSHEGIAEPLPSKAWYEIITTAALNIDKKLTFGELIKYADSQFAAAAKELGITEVRLFDYARKIIDSPAGSKIVGDKTVLDTVFEKAGGEAKKDTIQNRLEDAAIWLNFKTELYAGRDAKNLSATADRVASIINTGIASNTLSVISRSEWEEVNNRVAVIKGFFSRDDAQDKEGKPVLSAQEQIVEDMINPATPIGKKLASYQKGRDLQDALREHRDGVKGYLASTADLFEGTYSAYEAKIRKTLDTTGLTDDQKASEINKFNREQQEATQSFKELTSLYDAFKALIKAAQLAGREYEGIIGVIKGGWAILYDWCNLYGGPGVTMIKAVKGGGPLAEALASIPGVIVLLAQTGTVLSAASLTGIPAFTLSKELLNGFVATISGLFGGDPNSSASPPMLKSSFGGGGILPLLGFGAAIAMITSGKTVFEAINKTVGGFFQFAAALMPGGKKKGAKGAPGGGGGRRGPKFDVDKWVETIEAAKQRLSEAKTDREKKNAQRIIDIGVEKLKRAKDEGEDVPDGLWNLGRFNWLG
jgi:hypothetical protein